MPVDDIEMTAPAVRMKLVFPDSLVRSPVIATLIRQFDVTPSLCQASVNESEGILVCDLYGATPDVEIAIIWLEEQGIEIAFLSLTPEA